MKPSSKKVLVVKPAPRETDAAEESFADRAVARMIAGSIKAQRTGKFPKVY